MLLGCLTVTAVSGQEPEGRRLPRPNVLWITCEDSSPNLGCYGDPDAVTPTLDQMAKRGVRYTHAFSSAPVCAPSRSSLILGIYANSIGSHHMRSQAVLPEAIKPFTMYLRQAGYYCTNNVKQDYNFKTPMGTWDESSNKAHWRGRKPGQPFFSVFNYTVTHESQVRVPDAAWKRNTARLTPEQRHDPAKMHVPPYHPDTPVVRRDWARYHDNITAMDYQVADLLAELEKDDLAENTIVFYFSDHGAGLPRGKRVLYDSGIQVPMIVTMPKRWARLAPGKPGTTTDRLVTFVDFGPTVLSLTGIDIPKTMQGIPFLGDRAGPPRTAIVAFRDRMDERTDCSRAVRDHRYKYIRNYMHWQPWAAEIAYMNEMPTMKEYRHLSAAGKLTPDAARFMAPTKPAEELYDTQTDRWELKNLVDSKEHQEILARLRGKLHDDLAARLDLALLPEAEMHRRAEKDAPYTRARDDRTYYPLASLLPVVDSEDLAVLVKAAGDADPAIAWWGVSKLAARPARAEEDATILGVLNRSTTADNGSVRIAAAEGLRRRGKIEAALKVLRAGLSDPNPWVRHAAAEGIDALGTGAAPALEDLKKAADDKNEYVVRVVRHTLAVLGEK